MSNELDILPVNKTVVLYLPIEDTDVLVRTGTSSLDNTSFYQSLLHGYSKDYVSMDLNKRIEYIKKFKSSIFSKIDKNEWGKLSSSLIFFKENINILLCDFYIFINSHKGNKSKNIKKVIKNIIVNDEKYDDLETYKLITEMVPLEKGFKNNILQYVYETDSVSQCKKNIIKSSIKYYENKFTQLKGLSKNKIAFYIKKLEKLVQEIMDEAENMSIENLEKSDEIVLTLISDKFDRNIYCIDSNTRMPIYQTVEELNLLKKRKSMILLRHNNDHYEVVGRLLSGNKIQREFEYKDSLIKCIKTCLK